jgi:dihydroorotate dehydrogenase electron transfer subunit
MTGPSAQLPQAYKINHIRQENAKNKTFILDGSLQARPGQFVMAWLPGLQDKPFSLASSNPLSLTVAAVGPVSQALHALQPGDSIWVRGPLGHGYQLSRQPGDHLLLIGGGYGVAPLRFLAEVALAHGLHVSAIIGARTDADLLLVDAFQSLGIQPSLTTEDGSRGLRGVVTDALEPFLTGDNPAPAAVYTCGPTGMLRAVTARCRAADIPVQASWEAHMRCGIGLCGSCEVGQGWLTCLDGPVFPFDPEQVSPQQVNSTPL